MLTETLYTTLFILREHGKLYKSEKIRRTPHWFVPQAYLNSGDIHSLLSEHIAVNRQSINKLVELGHAHYTNSDRTVVIFIDKEARERRLKELASLGRCVELLAEAGLIMPVEDIRVQGTALQLRNRKALEESKDE